MNDVMALQARAILALRRDGFTVAEIMLALSVSKATVHRRLRDIRDLADLAMAESRHRAHRIT
jgi:DNA-directed RNA polymerase specialized sigma24 family protein